MASETPNNAQSVEVTADDNGADSTTDRLNRTSYDVRHCTFHIAATEVTLDPLRDSGAAINRASLRAA